MLTPVKDLSRTIESIHEQDGSIIFSSEHGTLKITVFDGKNVRVSYTEGTEFRAGQADYLKLAQPTQVTVDADAEAYYVNATELTVKVLKANASVSLYKNGMKMYTENPKADRELVKFDALRLKRNGHIETEDIETRDGIKKHVVSAEREYYDSFCETKTFITFAEDEKIFGLGQYEEGVYNYRGTTRYIHQANKQISLPMFISSKGYGVMFTTMSPAIFSDTAYGTYMYTSADRYIDYFILAEDSYEDIVSAVRRMTGSAAMLPKWAYSYVQSKERYETQEEIEETAAEFVERDIPLGCIVLDWMSWEDGKWGEKIFDKKRFPDVKAMVKKLNDDGIHFMLSIWPSMNECTENYAEFKKEGLLLPGTNVYDAFDEKAGKLYFDQVKRGLLSENVESWWCDSSEPITPEWEVLKKPLPEKLFYDFKERSMDSMYIDKGNGYGLYHARNIYVGQREVKPEKRVLNLTRSGYYGSHQYGAVVWSGDISASWDTFNKQIIAGLQLAMTSIAYWTLDIGAFFVKNGREWYWSGEYEDGAQDPRYRELYTRWLQYGAFLSMFRSHGTDVCREPWNFGDKGDPFYDAIVGAIRLREKLMPYIYSVAASVALEDKMFIKPLFFEFPEDAECYKDLKQFMVGDSLMVCPVTKPLYYGVAETSDSDKTIDVWLPKGAEWYDFHTGKKYAGGQHIKAQATIDRIPLYVKAGSIIPMNDEKEKTVLNIYPGDDCTFTLYNDAGEGYGYEEGDYSLQKFMWNDDAGKLSSAETGNAEYKVTTTCTIIGK